MQACGLSCADHFFTLLCKVASKLNIFLFLSAEHSPPGGEHPSVGHQAIEAGDAGAGRRNSSTRGQGRAVPGADDEEHVPREEAARSVGLIANVES